MSQDAFEPAPKILLVDDVPLQAQIVLAALAPLGCRATVVQSGSAALQAAAQEIPDLVLLDLLMPEMDGMEVLRALKADARTREVPVVFLTSANDPNRLVEGLEAGAADYVVKPVVPAELLARVRTYLGFKRSRDREKMLIQELQTALAEVKQLSGLIPICAHCRKVRNDQGFWQQVEDYLSRNSEILFTHGLCEDCIPLYFPDYKPPKKKAPIPPADAPETSKPKILVVDDSPTSLQALIQFLRQDYKILVATNGPVALELAAKEEPDLILLDVVMSEMDGYEVCQALKENPATESIPVIFLTAKNDELDEVGGFELGAVDYITKPFSLPVLRARVQNHLELKRYRDLLAGKSLVDTLTGIPNRLHFDELFKLAWDQAVRQHFPLTVIFLDVDGMRAFNTRYGRELGDEALRLIGQCLFSSKRRSTDLVARYGSDSFVCLLAGTNRVGALVFADLLRAELRDLDLGEKELSVSLGVASCMPEVGKSPVALLEAAIQDLHLSRRAMRNEGGVPPL